jgi:hypothetical protein
VNAPRVKPLTEAEGWRPADRPGIEALMAGTRTAALLR